MRKVNLTHNDHKKETKKTRPIGTANNSTTRASANCLSDLLEAVANWDDKSYEVISSEDLLYHSKNITKEPRRCNRT